MQDGPALGVIDRLAAIHLRDAFAKAGLVGKPGQLDQHAVVHTLAGEVEREAGAGHGAGIGSTRVGRKKISQRLPAQPRRCGSQSSPGGTSRNVKGFDGHSPASGLVETGDAVDDVLQLLRCQFGEDGQRQCFGRCTL